MILRMAGRIYELFTLNARSRIFSGLSGRDDGLKNESAEKRWDKPSHDYYRFSREKYPLYQLKPAGKYVFGTMYADYGETDSLYQELLRYIAENGLGIAGNAYEEYLIDEITEKNSGS